MWCSSLLRSAKLDEQLDTEDGDVMMQLLTLGHPELTQKMHLTSADGAAVPFELKAGRIGYLLCMEGAAAVAGAHGEETLQRHEAAHLAGPNQLTVKGDAHVLLIEMTGAGNF